MIQRGFTLIELLVVIMIIAVISGLLVTGIGAAMGSSKEADTSARLQQIQRGISNWITINSGTEPPYSIDPGSGIEVMTAGGYDDNNRLLLSALESLGDADFSASSDLVRNGRLVDVWGEIFHYRPYQTYALDPSSPDYDDRNADMGGYQLWSLGEDLTDDSGAGDDIANFSRD